MKEEFDEKKDKTDGATYYIQPLIELVNDLAVSGLNLEVIERYSEQGSKFPVVFN